jgi:hypothetical protein
LFTPVAVALIFIGLCLFTMGKRIPHPPAFEKYEYSDIRGNKYSIVLRKGKISDSSFLYSEKDSLIESIDWNKSDSIKTKPDSANAKPKSKIDSTTKGPDSSGQRSTESILKVIRDNTPHLRKAYNKHLRLRTFGGKITLRFRIAPSGNIASLYLIGNTTGNQAFSMDVIKEVDAWKFDSVSQKSDDVVTVPFTFSE